MAAPIVPYIIYRLGLVGTRYAVRGTQYTATGFLKIFKNISYTIYDSDMPRLTWKLNYCRVRISCRRRRNRNIKLLWKWKKYQFTAYYYYNIIVIHRLLVAINTIFDTTSPLHNSLLTCYHHSPKTNNKHAAMCPCTYIM